MKNIFKSFLVGLLLSLGLATASFASTYAPSTIWNSVFNEKQNSLSIGASGGGGQNTNIYSESTILNAVYDPSTNSLVTTGNKGTSTSTAFDPCLYITDSQTSTLFSTICQTNQEFLLTPASGLNIVLNGTTTLPGFPNGSILFTTSSGQISQDNSNFFYNNSTHSVGIGTTTPDTLLSIYQNTSNTSFSSLADYSVFDPSSGRTDIFKFDAGANNLRGGNMTFGETGDGYSATQEETKFQLNEIDFVQNGNYPINLMPNGTSTLKTNGSFDVGLGGQMASGLGQNDLTGSIMSVLHTGQVGINTTTPATALTVIGTSTLQDINQTGNANFGTITAGTWNGSKIGNVYGGTNQDSSAWTGYAHISGGVWSPVSISSSDLTDSSALAYLANNQTFTGKNIFNDSTTVATTTLSNDKPLCFGMDCNFNAIYDTSAPTSTALFFGTPGWGTTTTNAIFIGSKSLEGSGLLYHLRAGLNNFYDTSSAQILIAPTGLGINPSAQPFVLNAEDNTSSITGSDTLGFNASDGTNAAFIEMQTSTMQFGFSTSTNNGFNFNGDAKVSGYIYAHQIFGGINENTPGTNLGTSVTLTNLGQYYAWAGASTTYTHISGAPYMTANDTVGATSTLNIGSQGAGQYTVSYDADIYLASASNDVIHCAVFINGIKHDELKSEIRFVGTSANEKTCSATYPEHLNGNDFVDLRIADESNAGAVVTFQVVQLTATKIGT